MNDSTTQTKIERLFASSHVTRQDRLYALHLKGWSQRQLADDLGLTKATVSVVMSGKATSQRVVMRLSEITGVPVNTLYPDGRYAPTQEAA